MNMSGYDIVYITKYMKLKRNIFSNLNRYFANIYLK